MFNLIYRAANIIRLESNIFGSDTENSSLKAIFSISLNHVSLWKKMANPCSYQIPVILVISHKITWQFFSFSLKITKNCDDCHWWSSCSIHVNFDHKLIHSTYVLVLVRQFQIIINTLYSIFEVFRIGIIVWWSV